MTELDRLEEMRAAASERPSWMRRHKKLVMAVAILVAVLVGVGIALALLKKDMPVSGSISGQDGTAEASFVQAQSPSGPCTWTVVVDTDRLTIDGAKLTVNTTHACRGNLTVKNLGNVALRAQSFAVTSTAGTAASGFTTDAAAGCGTTIQPGSSAVIKVALNLSNVPVASSGTLAGNLGLVDEAGFSTANCSPAIS